MFPNSKSYANSGETPHKLYSSELELELELELAYNGTRVTRSSDLTLHAPVSQLAVQNCT